MFVNRPSPFRVFLVTGEMCERPSQLHHEILSSFFYEVGKFALYIDGIKITHGYCSCVRTLDGDTRVTCICLCKEEEEFRVRRS